MNMRRLVSILAIAALAGCGSGVMPPPPPDPITTPSEAIEALAAAYRAKDVQALAALLHADYRYFLYQPDPSTGWTEWDRTVELRIARRMFEPENIPPGDPALPGAGWLQSVTIALAPQSVFTERHDLYTNATPPGPLDPTRWIATEARYHADIFIATQGETDYQLIGDTRFVVVEDRSKDVGEFNKFTIYHWADLEPGAITAFKRPFF
jgi:hypothetical protein